MFGVMVHAPVDQVQRAGFVVVAPDVGAARAAMIEGATPRERLAARASLALVGADARGMRLRFVECPAPFRPCSAERGVRVLTVASGTARDEASLVPSFRASLVARDVSGRLRSEGERVGWQVLPNGQPQPSRAVAPVSHAKLFDAAQLVAARAAAAGWTLAPIRLYALAGGAMVVIVRFDDQTLFSNRNTAFGTTLFGKEYRPPVAQTMLLIEGPGDVAEGGMEPGVGSSYGAFGTHAGLPVPAWLERAPTKLRVTIQRIVPQGNLTFAVRCGTGAHEPTQAVCDGLFRQRAVLFSPVQSDNTCLGGATDESTVSGTVAGVAVDRSFSNCYGGVTGAWEKLLGVRR
jgi:hypothetical protein